MGVHHRERLPGMAVAATDIRGARPAIAPLWPAFGFGDAETPHGIGHRPRRHGIPGNGGSERADSGPEDHSGQGRQMDTSRRRRLPQGWGPGAGRQAFHRNTESDGEEDRRQIAVVRAIRASYRSHLSRSISHVVPVTNHQSPVTYFAIPR